MGNHWAWNHCIDQCQQSALIYLNTHTALLFISLLHQYRCDIREPFIMHHKILYSLHGHILLISFGMSPIVNRKTIDFYAWIVHQIGDHLSPIWGNASVGWEICSLCMCFVKCEFNYLTVMLMILYFIFLISFQFYQRGPHLNSSVANWKNLGRSFKVNNFWVNFGPHGQSTETSNGEIDTPILSDSSPMPFNPVLSWNQNRTSVSVSPCSFNVPWGQKLTAKSPK